MTAAELGCEPASVSRMFCQSLNLDFVCFVFFLYSSVKLWASAFGGEIKSISAKYSGSQLLQKVEESLPVSEAQNAAAHQSSSILSFTRGPGAHI